MLFGALQALFVEKIPRELLVYFLAPGWRRPLETWCAESPVAFLGRPELGYLGPRTLETAGRERDLDHRTLGSSLQGHTKIITN